MMAARRLSRLGLLLADHLLGHRCSGRHAHHHGSDNEEAVAIPTFDEDLGALVIVEAVRDQISLFQKYFANLVVCDAIGRLFGIGRFLGLGHGSFRHAFAFLRMNAVPIVEPSISIIPKGETEQKKNGSHTFGPGSRKLCERIMGWPRS